MKDFEALPHTADLKIRAYGASLEELFAHAVVGMFQVIEPIAPQCTSLNDRLVCPELPSKHIIDVSSYDETSLLVDFLSEALYLSDVYNEAYLKVTVHSFNEHQIKATVYGIPVQGFNVEIKAVTYHDLAIKKTSEGYQADIVFDI